MCFKHSSLCLDILNICKGTAYDTKTSTQEYMVVMNIEHVAVFRFLFVLIYNRNITRRCRTKKCIARRWPNPVSAECNTLLSAIHFFVLYLSVVFLLLHVGFHAVSFSFWSVQCDGKY